MQYHMNLWNGPAKAKWNWILIGIVSSVWEMLKEMNENIEAICVLNLNQEQYELQICTCCYSVATLFQAMRGIDKLHCWVSCIHS